MSSGERSSTSRSTSTSTRSEALFAAAQDILPGGVSSPVRAWKAVGGSPLFIARGRGSRVFDADGREYVDYVGSWGALILGHAHRAVVAAVKRAAEDGTTFGAPNERESELARLVRRFVPSMEKVRFVCSGTEATMSALRLARAATGRDKVVKLAGCYHGHADCLLAKAGSGVLTLGRPGSAGVPAGAVRDTLVVPYNDLAALGALLHEVGREVAAVIVEPIAANMGVVPPAPGYLEGLRRLTRDHGSLLIFDEVITGFRVHPGGAQALYGVRPDLTCLGKIVGGGLPAGAYGGRGDLMALVAPEGPVYQAGTLSGIPLAMAAGVATLEELERVGEEGGALARVNAAELAHGLAEGARAASVPLRVNRVATLVTPFFADGPVVDLASAERAEAGRYARFFRGLVRRGVYPPPSQFEAWFVSLAHTAVDIGWTVAAAREAFADVAAGA